MAACHVEQERGLWSCISRSIERVIYSSLFMSLVDIIKHAGVADVNLFI